MNTIKKIYLVINNKIRLTLINIINRVEVDHHNSMTLIDSACKMEFDRGSVISLGNKVRADRGTFLGVREKARLSIGNGTYIGRSVNIVSHNSIEIGEKVTIGPNCSIFDHDHDYIRQDGFISKPIKICDNVWIGCNCVILKGVTIGKGAVISAGSVVTRDVPADTIVIQKRETSYKVIRRPV